MTWSNYLPNLIEIDQSTAELLSMLCIQIPQLVQLINIVSNFIFHCNHYDTNRLFVKFRKSALISTAAAQRGGSLNAKFTFKGRSPPTILHRVRTFKLLGTSSRVQTQTEALPLDPTANFRRPSP